MFCCFLAAGLRNGRVECSFHCFTCTQRNQSSLFFCLLRVQVCSQVVLSLFNLSRCVDTTSPIRFTASFSALIYCRFVVGVAVAASWNAFKRGLSPPCVLSPPNPCVDLCDKCRRNLFLSATDKRYVTPGWESVHRLKGIVLFTHVCGKLSGKNVTGGATPPNHTHTHTYNHTCTNTHSSDISLKDKCQPETWLTGQNKPTSGGSSEVLFGRWRLINN